MKVLPRHNLAWYLETSMILHYHYIMKLYRLEWKQNSESGITEFENIICVHVQRKLFDIILCLFSIS